MSAVGFVFAVERPYLGATDIRSAAARPALARIRGYATVTNTIALVDDDRNILTSVSMALEAEGFAVRCYSDGAEALKGADRAAGRSRRARHQDAADGRDGAARAAAPAEPHPGHLPDLEGRRGRRAARPAHGRRRLHQEAVFAAPADRAHPGADPARRARARARGGAGRAGHRARPDDRSTRRAICAPGAASRSS